MPGNVDTAVYAVNSEQNIKITESLDESEEKQQLDTDKLKNYAPLSKTKNTIFTLPIDSTHVFNVKMGEKIMLKARGVTGKSCDTLPCVSNKVVNGRGTCWASSIASIIEYIQNGSNSDAERKANIIRNSLLKESSVGGTASAEYYINNWGGRKVSNVKGALSWAEVKEQILNYDNPVYMSLSEGTDYSHATVLCGYDYNSTTGQSRRMYLMDPNKSKWVIISYGSTYSSDYGYVFSWDSSVKK